jgi:hypothetical protein
MRPADVGRLVLLAAIWGASFLFLRVTARDHRALVVLGTVFVPRN